MWIPHGTTQSCWDTWKRPRSKALALTGLRQRPRNSCYWGWSYGVPTGRYLKFKALWLPWCSNIRVDKRLFKTSWLLAVTCTSYGWKSFLKQPYWNKRQMDGKGNRAENGSTHLSGGSWYTAWLSGRVRAGGVIEHKWKVIVLKDSWCNVSIEFWILNVN